MDHPSKQLLQPKLPSFLYPFSSFLSVAANARYFFSLLKALLCYPQLWMPHPMFPSSLEGVFTNTQKDSSRTSSS